jgi:hypothetical protein
MDFAIGRKWKGHVLYEHLNPGDFYSERSQAYFLRFEIIYTWLGRTVLGS